MSLSGDIATGPPFQIALLAEIIAFYGYFWRKQGETLGMRAWKIRVVDEAGATKLGTDISAIAHSAGIVGCLRRRLCLAILFDNKQTWHDKLSGTFVVHLPDRE